MNHPKSIPADKFRPMFDTSTDDGKIAVYSRWLQTGKNPWVKFIDDPDDDWDQSDPGWTWSSYDYNYPAEPKRTLVPWTKDTVPREAWFRRVEVTTQRQETPLGGVGKDSVLFGQSVLTYQELNSDFEHSLDGGKTWLPCGTWKEEA